jgi:hypothetical protein
VELIRSDQRYFLKTTLALHISGAHGHSVQSELDTQIGISWTVRTALWTITDIRRHGQQALAR